MSLTYALAELLELAEKALRNSEVSAYNAAVIAQALVDAEGDGLASHGLSRLPFYADQARSGKVNGHAFPRVEELTPAIVRVDAADGFAFPAVKAGLDAAFERIDSLGLVAVAVSHSHHFGVAGHHVERIARHGHLGIAMGNTPAAMAPWGGSKPVYGTNPLAFACPRAESPPLVIDLSLSKVARGKIMVADKQGRSIPEGWALDSSGAPTTDPKAALSGTMLPTGDAKGAALALMVEILSAALTGSNFAYEASSFFTATGPAPRVGHLLLLLNPAAFAADDFGVRVQQLFETISAQPGARLPGDRRLAQRAQAKENGVVVPESLYRDIYERASS